ncbi:MAG: hybrid sensor histidine kinase/response regulator [Gemmatimonadota bacterium]
MDRDQSLRVLVIDDEPGMRTGTERVLSRFRAAYPDLDVEVGFAVESAPTGEAGLEAIAGHRPDILLLDYKLPGISGLDVQNQLAEQGPEILTVMVSAYSSLQTVITATKRGAYDFLVKPFTPEELRGTVRKAAHHLLVQRQAIRFAEERRQIRFEFIRVLGHELKAPLAAVEGYLDIMQSHLLGAQIDAYDTVVARSLVRIEGMRKLILDLLDLTRIESGRKERTLAPVDLAPRVEVALELVAGEAARRKIRLVAQVRGPLVLTADVGEVDIILNNLVSNAVKYNRDGGSVTVAAEERGEGVVIAVSDSGIGMTQAETERLFREFSRIRNERTKDILGSGLGLSIVKKIAALYHGDVAVASQPDVGTTFTVSLARAGGGAGEGSRTAVPVAPAG